MSTTVGEIDFLRLPCAAATLRRASRAVTQLYEDAFRPLNLTVAQYTILGVLNAFGSTSHGRIGELLASDNTTLTRVLKLMRTRGWVQSVPGQDRREKYFSLTESGQLLFHEAKPRWRAVQTTLKETYGIEEWERMFQLVDRVTIGVQKVSAK